MCHLNTGMVTGPMAGGHPVMHDRWLPAPPLPGVAEPGRVSARSRVRRRDSAAAAQRPEERPDVLHQRARLLHGREVAALLHPRPALHVEDTLGPGAWRLDDLPREDGAAGRHLDTWPARRELAGVDGFVIEAAGGV